MRRDRPVQSAWNRWWSGPCRLPSRTESRAGRCHFGAGRSGRDSGSDRLVGILQTLPVWRPVVHRTGPSRGDEEEADRQLRGDAITGTGCRSVRESLGGASRQGTARASLRHPDGGADERSTVAAVLRTGGRAPGECLEDGGERAVGFVRSRRSATAVDADAGAGSSAKYSAGGRAGHGRSSGAGTAGPGNESRGCGFGAESGGARGGARDEEFGVDRESRRWAKHTTKRSAV